MQEDLLISGAAGDLSLVLHRYVSRFETIIGIYCPFFDTVEREEALDYILDHLAQNDFACLRKYDKRIAKPKTFLNRLARNLLIDFIRRDRGRKVLFSKIARLSETHRLIFQLKFWEGFSDHEVYQILITRYRETLSEKDFDRILSEEYRLLTDLNMWRLITDNRFKQSLDSEIQRNEIGRLSDSHTPLDTVLEKEMDEKRVHIQSVFHNLFAELSPEDKIILLGRFCDDQSVEQVADLLKCSRKIVLSRLARILDHFHREMEAKGITDLSEWADRTIDIEDILRPSAKK